MYISGLDQMVGQNLKIPPPLTSMTSKTVLPKIWQIASNQLITTLDQTYNRSSQGIIIKLINSQRKDEGTRSNNSCFNEYYGTSFHKYLDDFLEE